MLKINTVMIFNGVLVALIAFFLLKMLTKTKVDMATGNTKTSFLGFDGFDNILGFDKNE